MGAIEAIDLVEPTVWRTRVAEPGRMATALERGDPEGPVELLVAVFDVPDTHQAIGTTRRQIIDRGAFRAWIERTDFARSPVPIFADHGMAFERHGVALATLKIGKATEFTETEEGLVVRGTYNLRKQVARDLYSDLIHDPEGAQFSFRAPFGERTYEGADGYEHVRAFDRIDEISQVAFGAQRQTRLIALRAAIAPHRTETSDGPWDGPEATRRLPNRARALRAAHAWVDPEGDPEAKSSYRFIHHEVSADGEVGPANVTACRTGIAVLNGARGGTTIPERDRPGVWRHLAAHLRDADIEPPALRTLADWGWSEEEVAALLADPAFRTHLIRAVRQDPEARALVTADPAAEYYAALWKSLRGS